MQQEKFADRLRALMKRRGVSQAELSRATGVAQAHLCRYLKNDREPMYDNARELADFFGVSVDFILSGSPATEGSKSAAIAEREAGIIPARHTRLDVSVEPETFSENNQISELRKELNAIAGIISDLNSRMEALKKRLNRVQ